MKPKQKQNNPVIFQGCSKLPIRLKLSFDSTWAEYVKYSPEASVISCRKPAPNKRFGALLCCVAISSMMFQTKNNYKGNYVYESIMWC